MENRYHIGHAKLTNVLEKQVKSGQLPHSQLFVDSGGYGGFPLALSLSEFILNPNAPQSQTHIQDHPDLHCVYPTLTIGKGKSNSWDEAWREFCADSPYAAVHDWLARLESGNKQGSIRVDAIMEMHRKASLKAFSGKNKVFIIWGADFILESAANKLLKLLEEPPKNTYFILIAAYTDNILATILSRCQITKLPPLNDHEMLSQAQKDYPSQKQLIDIIGASNGSWRRLVHTVENMEEIRELEQLWVEGLRLAFRARGNKKIVLSLFEWGQTISQKSRESQKYFLLFGLDIIRSALMVQYKAKSIQRFVSFTGFNLDKFAVYVHSENILELKKLFEESYYELVRNANPKILFSCFSLKLSRLLNKKESTFLENVD